MHISRHSLSTAVLVATFAAAGCSSASAPQTATAPALGTEPKLSSNLRVAGRGYPYGTTGTREPLALTERSSDPTYGRTSSNPIRLGGEGNGSHREQRFLSSLRGPTGETITYERSGSCCGFETPNSELGGMLDVYVITYAGQSEPITLYLNMYDPGPALIPVGFTPF
jgi:hypothetical protein